MALELILVRHAVAFERDRKRWPDDRQRPLTPAGRARFRRAAPGIARFVARPGCVLSSPLVRARETAELLCSAARWPKPVFAEELAPEGSAVDVLALLGRKRAKRIAVVGHEPALSRLLIAYIAGTGSGIAVKLKKGGIACVEFASTVRPGAGVLLAIIPPRALRRMRG